MHRHCSCSTAETCHLYTYHWICPWVQPVTLILSAYALCTCLNRYSWGPAPATETVGLHCVPLLWTTGERPCSKAKSEHCRGDLKVLRQISMVLWCTLVVYKPGGMQGLLRLVTVQVAHCTHLHVSVVCHTWCQLASATAWPATANSDASRYATMDLRFCSNKPVPQACFKV